VFAPAHTATVLVVEDDSPLRDLYKGVLSANRYRVLTAPDGLSALELIDIERPDVVVLDLGLPLVSGWDVYRDLRSRPETEKLPVIIVTGHERKGIRAKDVAVFLKKPVDPLVLADAVDEALRRSR
jgi:two-component system, OmpR family, alkaline phosphatase synthesis response regulator PhoP